MSASATVAPPERRSALSRAANQAVLSISRHEHGYLLLALTIFGLLDVYRAAVSPLWFDEFFTFFISRIPSFHEMLRAMPADSQPPLQYLLTAISVHAFGPAEWAIRLPAILAHLAAGALTWRIVRLRGTSVQALFATLAVLGATTGGLLLSGLAVNGMATNARPYELMLAFTALAFACWQAAAARHENRLLPLCGLACAIGGGVLTHHLTVLQIAIFFIAGEITRTVLRRRIDWALLAAGATGLLPMILTVPLAFQTRRVLGEAIRHSGNFWGRPSPLNLLYWPLMTPWLLLVPLVLLLLVPCRKDDRTAEEQSAPPLPRHELAAAAALSCVLPAQMLLAVFVTGYSQARYAIGSCLGLALLCAWAWPRLRISRPFAQPALAAISVGYAGIAVVTLVTVQIAQPIWRPGTASAAVPRLLKDVPGNLPIVDANAFEYLPHWWYSKPALRDRLTYLSDLRYAELHPGLLAELSLTADKRYMPFPVESYSSFLAEHGRFLLLCTGSPQYDWISSRLPRDGWRLTLLTHSGRDRIYRVDRP